LALEEWEHATALFRIAQKALTNIARHANATRVDLRLHQSDAELTLEIHDDGVGITEEQFAGSGSIGILGMQGRAALIGGELTVASELDDGTTVRPRLPLLQKAQGA
jgi:signal transduction histidine kinase